MAETEIYSVEDFAEPAAAVEGDAAVEDQIEVESEDGETSDEIEIEVEGKGAKVEADSEVSKVSALEAQIRELTNEVLKLSATKKEVPVAAAAPAEPEKLTRAQLVQIMKEHADDPEVLLNVVDYMADQKTKEVRDKTIQDLDHKQWHSQLSGTANRILAEDQDGYLAANPQVKQQLSEAAINLGLDGHPVGQLAAYAIMRLGEAAKKQPVKEAPAVGKGKMDKTRPKTTPNKASLTADQLSIAKKFGLKPETYAQFLPKKA